MFTKLSAFARACLRYLAVSLPPRRGSGEVTPADAVRHYRFIDSLSGLAFLGVLASHLNFAVLAAHGADRYPGYELARSGRLGVQLFFMASALTLFMSVGERRKHENFPNLNFFVRRLFRIGPLFWARIAFYHWLHGTRANYWAPNGIHMWQVVVTALFIHGWHPESINSVVPGGWSIAAEMSFYLLIPGLAAVIRSMRAALLGLGLAVMGLVAFGFLLDLETLRFLFPSSPAPLIKSAVNYILPLQLPVFLLGIVAYFVTRNEVAMSYLKTRGRAQLLLLLVPVALAALAYSPAGFAGSPFVPVVASIVFLGLIAGLRAVPVGCLVNRPLCWLGTVSFSCYITHFAALAFAGRYISARRFSALPSDVGMVAHFLCLGMATLALTAAVSTFTHALIERPGIALSRHLVARWEKQAREQASSRTVRT